MVDQGLQYVRRRNGDSRVYFIANRSGKAIDGWIPLAVPAPGAAIFDPMSGKIGRAATRPERRVNSDVYLQLAPGQSCIVETFKEAPSASPWLYVRAQDKKPLDGTWDISFVKGGADIPPPTSTDKLGSWTEL